AEVRDLARQHGRARALPALGVRACAEHRVAVDDGGRLHPRAVLAALRHVADEIRRAGLQDLDAVVGGVALAFAAAPRGFRWRPQDLPVIRVAAALQVAGAE